MVRMDEINVLITMPFPEELLERLKALSSRIDIQFHPVKTAEELPIDLLEDIEVLYTSRVIPNLEDMPNLRWVQLHDTGVQYVMEHPALGSNIQITTMSGVSAPGMAEYALMTMLALGRRVHLMMEDKESRRWPEDRIERFMPVELRGSTVGIVGYGSVGREVARICHSFKAKIVATKADLRTLEDTGYSLDGHGDPKAELVERLYPPQAIASMASLCDFLIISVPITNETRGMVGEKVFKMMKTRSFLIDISCGGVVDHGALVEALNEGRIAGAALDVYPVEPLPESSPLWEMPNVLLSPHVAGLSLQYYELAIDCFTENMQRYLSDQTLLNLYKPERGY
jgi:phosphoglycerate dehydrogenase-like enzyme